MSDKPKRPYAYSPPGWDPRCECPAQMISSVNGVPSCSVSIDCPMHGVWAWEAAAALFQDNEQRLLRAQKAIREAFSRGEAAGEEGK